MFRYLVIGILLLAGVAVAYVINACPCERFPGLWLSGEEVSTPVQDWSFANEAPLCQIEVSSWRPHSVNLNCMSTGPDLFVSCAYCEDKLWSQTALRYPNGKIKIGEKLYPVKLTRVVDPVWLDIAWRARALKLKQKPNDRPDHWWSFRLTM